MRVPDVRRAGAALRGLVPGRDQVNPVSGDDLAGRYDNWREDRRRARAGRTDEENTRRLRHRIMAAMGVAVVVVTLTTGFVGERWEDQASSAASSADAAESQLRVARASGEPTDGARRLSDLTTSANQAAITVAGLQDEAIGLEHEALTSPNADNGAPSLAMRNVATHRRQLADWFDRDLYVVDDERAYEWTNVLPYGADQVDPRFTWYVDRTVRDVDYGWHVEAVAPVITDGIASIDRVHVTWTCRRGGVDGDVLAWARADHDGSRFVSFEITRTGGAS